MKNKSEILVVSPTPPPMHGAALASQIFLDSDLLNELFALHHMNARYVEKVEDLQGLSLKKLFLLFRYLFEMLGICLRHPVELVILTPTFYVGSFLKDSLFIWLAWLLRRKNIVAWFHMSFRTMEYERRGKIFQWYVRTTFSRCTHYLCVSESLLADLPDFMPNDRRVAVANGVSGPISPIGFNHCDGLGNTELNLLYLSNLDEAKGWRVLFTVAQRLHREFPELDIKVDFYGSPSKSWPLAKIEEVFKQQEYSEKIRYRGFADSELKAKAFSEATIFCFPSFNEAFPLSILEAMSYGLPIVSSDVGAVKDALIDKQGGFLVTPENEDDFFRALCELVRQPQVRERMGRFNRARWQAEYNQDAYLKRWQHFIEQVFRKC